MTLHVPNLPPFPPMASFPPPPLPPIPLMTSFPLPPPMASQTINEVNNVSPFKPHENLLLLVNDILSCVIEVIAFVISVFLFLVFLPVREAYALCMNSLRNLSSSSFASPTFFNRDSWNQFKHEIWVWGSVIMIIVLLNSCFIGYFYATADPCSIIYGLNPPPWYKCPSKAFSRN